jgi:hypothetical protein
MCICLLIYKYKTFSNARIWNKYELNVYMYNVDGFYSSSSSILWYINISCIAYVDLPYSEFWNI